MLPCIESLGDNAFEGGEKVDPFYREIPTRLGDPELLFFLDPRPQERIAGSQESRIGGFPLLTDPLDQAVEPDRLFSGDDPFQIFRIKFPLENLRLQGINPHGILDRLAL